MDITDPNYGVLLRAQKRTEDSLQQQLTTAKEEIELHKSVIRDIAADAIRLQSKLAEAEKAVEKYSLHLLVCESQISYGAKCNCGLDALKKTLGQKETTCYEAESSLNTFGAAKS